MFMKIGGVGLLACGILLLGAVSSVNSYTRSNLKPIPELNIFSASGSSSSSSNPALNNQAYINHNGNGAKPGSYSMGNNGYQTVNGYNGAYSNNHNNNNGQNGGNGASNSNGGNGQYNNPAIIDPHYVFGAPQSIHVLPNLPIFPYNSPTIAPSFQQFPQFNRPGSVFNQGIPQSLQPVNPYNPSFAFGQQPFYNAPGGTGGPPGGSAGILGGSGGGVVPFSGNYPSPNMFNNKPQTQNPYNRQTQADSNSAERSSGPMKFTLVLATFVVALQKFIQFSSYRFNSLMMLPF